MQYLLSVPGAMAASIQALEQLTSPEWYAACDPPGRRLGSGGGSAHLLLSAWRSTAEGQSFEGWLRQSRKLMIHGGGQGRRLPAYAPVGKLFMPVPVWRWSSGQRIDQKLLDLQVPALRRIFAHASDNYRIMIASGDVLVRFEEQLPQFPEVDVLCIGLWGQPEEAQHFGVFFCRREDPGQLAFFKQKPSPATIRDLTSDYLPLLDAGIWLLSNRAARILLKSSGWSGDADSLKTFEPGEFELYTDFGRGLGDEPEQQNADLNSLTCAVVPLNSGEFYHFGRSRDLVDSSLRLQNLVLGQKQMRHTGVKLHPDLFVQNAAIDINWRSENHRIWVENSHIGRDWKLSTDHVLTGIPCNDWQLKLEPGTCLDMVPLEDKAIVAVRVYGIDDAFRGELGSASTQWLGRPVSEWFEKRAITLEQAQLDPAVDIQQAPIFVVLPTEELDQDFLEWLITAAPQNNDLHRARWINLPRISAEELADRANITDVYRRRREFLRQNIEEMAANHQNSVFYSIDLKHLSCLYVQENLELPPPLDAQNDNLIKVVHDRMLRAEVMRHRNLPQWLDWQDEAFALLRKAVTDPFRQDRVTPRCDTAPDQIVWGRCPVRLDLAGGWTDTPPYCLLQGGKVVNLAVNLNGQPPLQAFVKRSKKAQIVLRSIDLGVQQVVRTYEQIGDYASVGSEFSVAKAALALAGFHPDFCQVSYHTLEEQLRAFGGGLELSFVAAVPKGSGLGTSSILAATILGALGDFCALGWGTDDICNRVLVLEQMLTTGGGWQDQFGAVLHGVKMLETQPGLDQTTRVKWLPEHILQESAETGNMLLYYTGITRVAKNILQEIVRGMFLNDSDCLAVLHEIKLHAQATHDAIQMADWNGLCKAIDLSWKLNQRLDSGTNPIQVQKLLHQVQDYVAGAKLLGAGGGGYLLMFAKDTSAAHSIRQELKQNPPNTGARFVDVAISGTGLQITRS